MKKIFIIEDDEFTSNILMIALGKKYSLTMATDTNNLIEKINVFLPDLLITDNFVGQKVATEIINEIRAQPQLSNIPVILFSGHPNIEKLAKEIAASAYLAKPFSLKDLNACIDNVLALGKSDAAM